MVRWAWGSRSMRQTVLPISARAAPRLTVVVVLPTPPFWFIRAMVRMGCRLRGPREPSVSVLVTSRIIGGRGAKTRYFLPVGCGQKKKPSAVAGKVSFCFGARVGARAQNVRGNFRTSRPTVSGNHRLRATCRREFDGPYFLDLVVDFFEELFLPPELLEPDLLPIFFAMALTSFLG